MLDKVIAFLDEVIELGKRQGLSISHEDVHGAFIVRPFNEDDAEWLMAAQDYTAEYEEGEDV